MNFKFITIALLALVFFQAGASEFIVCPDCRLTSIKDAIELASDGDRIIIKSGLYAEGNIVIDKSLHITGEDWPEIDGENNSEIITVIADNVVIEGLQIQNVGTSYIDDRAGLRVKKSSEFIIRNNKFKNNFFGIYLEHSEDGEVSGNELIGEAVAEMSSGNGIHLWYCENIRIENNKVSNHRDGIYLEFVDSSLVINNISEHNLRYGLHFMFSNNDKYEKNTFRDNGAGVAVMFSKNIGMTSNLFEYNWGKASYGLLLKEIYDAEISRNVFHTNTIGIYVEGSTRINYTNNDFLENGWAVKFRGGCLDNKISGNNFISNTFDLAVENNQNDNTFDGNYWSDYNGYDLDRNGIGDVPYRPVKLFNFVVNRTPEAMVMLRSILVDLMNLAEKVSPVFTPKNVLDNTPSIKELKNI